ncbi:hypothetical protein DL98DRAFT_644078 [Cadophora sp. DSE1049]|nr:hypothetical protein DL98DRAFT_644078 [Cadophora sp. DSE1049]
MFSLQITYIPQYICKMSNVDAGMAGHQTNPGPVLDPQEGILPVTNPHFSVHDLRALLQTAMLERDDARMRADHTQTWGYAEAERARTLAIGLDKMRKSFFDMKEIYAKSWGEQNEVASALRGKLHERDAYIENLHQRLRLFEQTGIQPVSGFSDPGPAVVANPFSRPSVVRYPGELPGAVQGQDVVHFQAPEPHEASTSAQKSGGIGSPRNKDVGGRDVPM